MLTKGEVFVSLFCKIVQEWRILVKHIKSSIFVRAVDNSTERISQNLWISDLQAIDGQWCPCPISVNSVENIVHIRNLLFFPGIKRKCDSMTYRIVKWHCHKVSSCNACSCSMWLFRPPHSQFLTPLIPFTSNFLLISDAANLFQTPCVKWMPWIVWDLSNEIFFTIL